MRFSNFSQDHQRLLQALDDSPLLYLDIPTVMAGAELDAR
jgi:hypothetical protein